MPTDTNSHSSSLTDLLIQLHNDQSLLEEQFKKTQDKLSDLAKKVVDTSLTSDQLSQLQVEFDTNMQEFLSVTSTIREHVDHAKQTA